MKLNLLQNLAFWWYRKIDVNGFLFTSLKSIPIYFRFIFYFSLILAFSYSVEYLFEFTLNIFSNYNYIKNHLPKIESIFNMLKYISIFLISMIIFYEFIFKIDLNKLINEKEQQQKQIKINKSQWWRLRNKNIFFRIFFYLSIGFTFSQLIYVYYLNYVFKYFNTSYGSNGINIQFNNIEEQLIFKNLFEQGLNNIMFVSMIVYLIFLILSEIYIYKTKRKNI
jgi:hypothetical protein